MTSLVYTFGNHMHWVDMEWLWGYGVLPGSVRDMLHLCRQTGAKGNVNFDGVGYEKLAVENSEAFAELREAVRSGMIEVVGASYGQPYGQFHGGESNVRQRVYGVRAVRRLFGVSPATFWEEEFDFFPQLPQILAGVGIRHASVFIQWTWHTPEVPRETEPAERWVGQDGTALVAATCNALNLHQWPEDVDALLAEISVSPHAGTTPLIQQWLELMPSSDWMCRSEVLLPRLKALLADDRFKIECKTLGGYLAGLDPQTLPERSYRADQTFHGMTLGKNADRMRRLSRTTERLVLEAETMATALSLLRRPYAQWDVYPTWELEEAWRALLQAQHHDNDECEGLCGHIGRNGYDGARSLAHGVREAQGRRLAREFGGRLVFNPLGWPAPYAVPGAEEKLVLVPPCGWCAVDEPGLLVGVATVDRASRRGQRAGTTMAIGEDARLEVSAEGWSLPNRLFGLDMTIDGERVGLLPDGTVRDVKHGLKFLLKGPHGEKGQIAYKLRRERAGAVDVEINIDHLPRLDGGLNAGLQAKLWLGVPFRIVADGPYGVSEANPRGSYRKKYPTGDWMTSPQWFETVERPFHALSFVDLVAEDGSGLLVLHDGSQQWFADDDGVRVVLTVYDPWDEDRFDLTGRCVFRLIPHQGLTNAERWRLAQEFVNPPYEVYGKGEKASEPFSLVACDAPGVAITAVYRESESPRLDRPTYVRLVELDGREAHANLTFGATVAAAWRTNLLGEPTGEPCDHDGHRVRNTLRPYEIATVCVDLVEARKQVRDLDAKREIWATVHRQDEPPPRNGA